MPPQAQINVNEVPLLQIEVKQRHFVRDGGGAVEAEWGPWWPGRVRLAHTRGVNLAPLRWLGPPAGPAIELLDQTRLPAEEVTVTCRDVTDLIGRASCRERVFGYV